jgi:hypothetical protein
MGNDHSQTKHESLIEYLFVVVASMRVKRKTNERTSLLIRKDKKDGKHESVRSEDRSDDRPKDLARKRRLEIVHLVKLSMMSETAT